MSKVRNITFFGYASANKNEVSWKDAYKISQELAKRKYKIVDGGGPGIMWAATEGAESVDGDTVAVYYRPQSSTMFEGASLDNVADQKMYYSDYVKRTLKLIELGDVFFIFNGGTGTFSEFAMTWGLARLYYGHHKPLILVGSFWHDVISSIEKNMRIREEEKKVINIANNAEEALETFDKLIKEINQRDAFQATKEEEKFVL